MDMLRDFLIELDGYYKQFLADKANCPFVFVFTDESYVNKRHGLSFSYFGEWIVDRIWRSLVCFSWK